MKLGKTGRSIAQAFEPWRQLEFFSMILLWILGWFVMSVVVFLRKDFGERYLSWLNLFFGYIAAGTFAGLTGWFISYAAGERFSWTIMELCFLSFIGLSLYHRYIIRHKNKTGLSWHSLYSGTPLLPVPMTAETLNKWIEPGAVLALALLMRLLHNTPVALWLFVSGTALLIHEHITYHLQRNEFLDLRDAQIEAAHWKAAMQGRPAEQTHGFVIAASNIELVNQTPELKGIFDNLAPDLKSILDDDAEEAA